MNPDPDQNDPVAKDQQLVIAQMKQQLQRYEDAISSIGNEPPDEDVIDLREYWNVLVRRKSTVFVTVGVMLVCMVIAIAMMTPIFRATTVVQIERESGKVLEYQSLTAEETANAKDFYQTQYELLRSRTLARRVIDQLGLQESGYLGPGDAEAGFIAGFVASIRGALAGGEEGAQEELPPDLESLFLQNLSVEPVKNSRLVRLHYDSPDRQEAALVINALASAFVDMSLERRFEASTYAKGFLEERIKQVRADLEDSERALVDYTQARGIINQNDKLGILTDKLREMNRALVAAEAERFEAESQYQEMLTASSDSLTDMLASPVIQDLKRQRTDLQASYRENLKIYKPGYPAMQQLQEKIAQIEAEIAAEISNIRDGIKVQYQAKLREEAKLGESILATQEEILALQDRSTDFQTLKREVDTNRELYDGLLQRMKEVGVAAGVSNNNISVIDPAEVPRKRYKPKLLVNMAIALVLGLVVGVLLAFLFESLDDTVKTAENMEKLLDKPVLGIIPRVLGKEIPESGVVGLHAHYAPSSAFAEAYRSMRTALMFSTGEGAPKVMHFTSVNAGEGKTTTAVSTAINFTQTGGDVLLIDADLRNPSLHKLFQIANHKGLTNYLSGRSRPADIAQATGIKGLFLISSGPVPPNPAELLAGGKMVDLVALAARRFDYVIIDSPPVLGLADALILADLAQATLLVAAANSTRTGAIEAGLKRLRHSRANILGTVLTKFETHKSSYDYNYSYGYGGQGDGQERQSG